MELKRGELERFLQQLLKVDLFDDYCPNGLQIEGRSHLKKILFSVSATRESAEYAAAIKAHALIVHHGLFWKFHGSKTLTGPFYQRIAPLVKNDINLYAYHLPLDAHEEVGNAASLAALLGLEGLAPFGQHKGMATGMRGNFKRPIEGEALKEMLAQKLGHSVLYSRPDIGPKKGVESVGIITGGARSEWREALHLGLDAYITGEMSEHDYHESREAGIHMYAGGHHATEKFGIRALMKKVKEVFPHLECEFLDSENPA